VIGEGGQRRRLGGTFWLSFRSADQVRWHVTHVFPPLLGWVQASQAQSVSGKTEDMMDGCAGGGEVVLRITGV
jgi:hypothetical protein